MNLFTTMSMVSLLAKFRVAAGMSSLWNTAPGLRSLFQVLMSTVFDIGFLCVEFASKFIVKINKCESVLRRYNLCLFLDTRKGRIIALLQSTKFISQPPQPQAPLCIVVMAVVNTLHAWLHMAQD